MLSVRLGKPKYQRKYRELWSETTKYRCNERALLVKRVFRGMQKSELQDLFHLLLRTEFGYRAYRKVGGKMDRVWFTIAAFRQNLELDAQSIKGAQ